MKRTVREVYDLSQLDSLAATWEQLHQETPQATFFQTLDWLKITFQHFSREQKLRLLTQLRLVADERGRAARYGRSLPSGKTRRCSLPRP